LNGIQEVTGSIPVSSTRTSSGNVRFHPERLENSGLFLFLLSDSEQRDIVISEGFGGLF
jgi:hypothetical protein